MLCVNESVWWSMNIYICVCILLLVSIAIKLYHSQAKLAKKADNLWSKKLTEVCHIIIMIHSSAISYQC